VKASGGCSRPVGGSAKELTCIMQGKERFVNTMKIEKLVLHNFQGIKSLVLDFSGDSASIYGDNGTGKTTVYNAITWVLFDKASTGTKGFTPQTRDTDGGNVHSLEHAAELTIRTDSGRIIVLQKVFSEVWKKKRGSAEQEITGNTVNYSVDGVPTKERDFQVLLDGMFGDGDRVRCLTQPDYFSSGLPWEKRREILLSICGDVLDDDVIASSPELSGLPAVLRMPGTDSQYYSVADYQKIAAAAKRDVNREIDTLPGRIDEAHLAVADIPTGDEQAIKAASEDLENQKAGLLAQKAALAAGDNTDNIRRSEDHARKCRYDLENSRRSFEDEEAARRREFFDKVGNLKSEITNDEYHLARLKSDAVQLTDSINKLKGQRDSLLDEYASARAMTFDPANEICPTCGQALPPEKVEEIHGDWNRRKSEKLEAINRDGQSCGKAVIAEKECQLDDMHRRIEELEDCISQKKTAMAQSGGIYEPRRFEDTDVYRSLVDIQCQADAAVAIEKAAAGKGEASTKLDEQIRQIDSEISGRRADLAKLVFARQQEERVRELQARQKDLARQYEQLEHGLYLCEQFTRAKVAMLDHRINDRFGGVKFRLFQEQMNGGVKEDCEVLVPAAGGALVPFGVANNAARINAGLEIIDTLSAAWGLSMPVVVDNAESVTALRETTGQIIRLVVSQNDKTLRLELDKN